MTAVLGNRVRSRRRATAGLLVAVLLATSVVVAAGRPAQAAASPTTPVFPRTIDGYAPYEAESGCDPTAKPGALEVVRILRATYGTTIGTNVPRSCTASNSGHEEGRAVDWMTNVRDAGQREKAEAFLGWLLADDEYGNAYAMARRLGVMYVIWDSRKLYLWNTAAGWTEYSDCLTVRVSAADDNYCHRNHVHLSLSWAGARAESSWYWLGGEARPACPQPAVPAGSTPARTSDLGFVPVTPARILDTRSGEGSGAGPCWLAGGHRLDLQVTGRGGLPGSSVAAVVLNLTATGAKLGSWLAAYPAGGSFGGTSSVNVPRGGTSAATVVAPVGAQGRVSLLAGPGASDVVVDVVGYYPADGSGSRYVASAPRRVLDASLAVTSWTGVPAGLPADAVSVVANVTTDRPAVPGYLALAPWVAANEGRPATSSVNADRGDTVANRAFSLMTHGALGLYAHAPTRGVLDVTGYFAPVGAGFTTVSPSRIVDSRTGLGGVARLQGGRPVTVQVGGLGGVPVGATAAVVTLTNDAAARRAHLTAWAHGQSLPGTSDLNLVAVSPRANLAVVALDPQGRMDVLLNDGASDLIVDVLGFMD